MSTHRRNAMSNVDKAWLEMDSPANLMIINGVMLFDEVIDFEKFTSILQERLVGRFARFRQRIVESPPGAGRLYWENDPYFDIRSHIRHIALPAPGEWWRAPLARARREHRRWPAPGCAGRRASG